MPVYLIILAGALLRKVGILRREHDEPMMHVVFNVLYPCFILDKILGSNALRSGTVVTTSIGIGFLELCVGICVGLIVAKLLRFQKGQGLRTFAFSAGLQNFGYTAIPIVQQLWEKETVSVLMVHNLGVELSVWTVGVMLMAGEKNIPWKKLLNGPAVAVVLGLLLVAFKVDREITGPFRTGMQMLGSGAFPLALLITGAVMYNMILLEKPTVRVVIGASLLRLAILPLLLLCAAKFLPLAVDLKRVLIVQAAMPAAMTPMLIAKLYGGRPAIAAQIIVFTTIASIVSLPLIIMWGIKWVF